VGGVEEPADAGGCGCLGGGGDGCG
jgi:hypothetical protein